MKERVSECIYIRGTEKESEGGGWVGGWVGAENSAGCVVRKRAVLCLLWWLFYVGLPLSLSLSVFCGGGVKNEWNTLGHGVARCGE